MPDRTEAAASQSRQLQDRALVKVRLGDLNGALADLRTVLGLSGAPMKGSASALFNRGAVRAQQGDHRAAVADLTTAMGGMRPWISSAW